MFTSNYRNLAKIKAPLAPVSISRGKPRWLKGGWLNHVALGTTGRNYDDLAPSAAALKRPLDEYHRSFAAQLAALDARKVYDDLGANAVLLCFCEVGVMCHRRIVAEWLEYHLGVEVPELGGDPANVEIWTTEAYPHYMTPEQKVEWFAQLPEDCEQVQPLETRP